MWWKHWQRAGHIDGRGEKACFEGVRGEEWCFWETFVGVGIRLR
jgi:hypothetical protein